MPGEVARRLAEVRARIAEAARRAGRDEAEVRLVVVTKDVPPERVREALAEGACDLGENRAQEMLAKMAALADAAPAPRWHFIGVLQRNKVRLVVGRAALIHSVDSVALGRAVAARARAAGAVQEALLEVNVAGEPTKHGVAPAEVGEAARALAAEPGIALRGLMTIAPADDPAAARGAFRTLRSLRDELAAELPGLVELSMGMSADFEAAIEEGATIVRVGTAIFGPRP
jgi:pyridoxal phosphate enzyme (YggS family)